MSGADWSRPDSVWPHSYDGSRRRSGVSTSTAGWALAWAILSCCFVGNVISTVLALRVLAHRRATGQDRGTGLAIGALAVNAVSVGLVVLVGYAALVIPEPTVTDRPDPTEYDAMRWVNADPDVIGSIGDLEYGDCIDIPALRGEEAPERRVECEESHDLEVFESVLLEDSVYPGEGTLKRRAARDCRGKKLTDYVGVPYRRAHLDVTWVVPDAEDWEYGERTYFCIARDPKGPRGESLFGSRR